MPPLINHLTWSRSRHATFEACERRYWFQYYGAWGGWDRDAPADVRGAYILKQLKSRWAWAGTVVHDALEATLGEIRRGRAPDADEVAARAVGRMRADFRASRDGAYLRRPKAPALFEHHYEVEVDPEGWQRVRDHVVACIHAFWTMGYAGRTAALDPAAWLAVEDLSSFDFEGTKVWVVPDLAVREGEGARVLDWKTGRGDDPPDPIQLACYALYGTDAWGVAPASIATEEVRLATGIVHEARMDAARLAEVAQTIRGSIAAMRARLPTPDATAAPADAFPRVDSDAPCHGCNFRAACRPELGAGRRLG